MIRETQKRVLEAMRGGFMVPTAELYNVAKIAAVHNALNDLHAQGLVVKVERRSDHNRVAHFWTDNTESALVLWHDPFKLAARGRAEQCL
jgi:predicted transcriptional regulator